MIDFQNWYETTLTNPITAAATNIALNTPPSITEGYLVLDYDIPALREIIHFTSHDSVSVTVPSSGDTGTGGTGRGYESTTARQHNQNAKVRMVFTAGTARAIQTAAATIANQNNNGGWVARAEAPVYASNNGNKEFTFTLPGDLTGVLGQGMKIKLDRATAPPTQAMSFTAASSQYASKTTPSGLSFTTAYTCESWIYVNSYSQMGIITRDDGTNGWVFGLSASGQLESYYRNGAGFTIGDSYQSVTLKRWQHAAVSVNVTTKVFSFYLNGTLIPALPVAGTPVTTMTQGTSPITLGRTNTSLYFDGYMAEARVWSVVQTQTAIQNNMGINLTGSETNLVFCVRGNGVWTDLTVNANTLTASNGAGFVTMPTTIPYYYNPTECFVITGKPTYSSPNTVITAFGGTDFVLPNATMLNLYFSMQRAPFGFSVDRGKWITDMLLKNDISINAPASNTWYNYNGGAVLQVPTGAWRLFYEGGFYATRGGTTVATLWVSLSTSTTAESDSTLSSFDQVEGAAGQMTAFPTFHREKFVPTTAMTQYSLITKTSVAPTTSLTVFGSFVPTVITAECAYI